MVHLAADFGLQVPKELYEFPGYPWPADADLFPKGPAVADYIQKFARESDLYDNVKFNTVSAVHTRAHNTRLSLSQAPFHPLHIDMNAP